MKLSQEKKVYTAAARIPSGRVATYGQLARLLRRPGLARFVGRTLSKNRNPKIPCHRVVRSDGSVGGFNRGTKKKIAMLRGEGVVIKNGKINLSVFQASF